MTKENITMIPAAIMLIYPKDNEDNTEKTEEPEK